MYLRVLLSFGIEQAVKQFSCRCTTRSGPAALAGAKEKTMKSIKLNELNEVAAVSEQEAADVKGGPIYMKIKDRKFVETQDASIGGANFLLGDGSVKF